MFSVNLSIWMQCCSPFSITNSKTAFPYLHPLSFPPTSNMSSYLYSLHSCIVSSSSLSSLLLWGKRSPVGAIGSREWIALESCIFTLSVVMKDEKDCVLLRFTASNVGIVKGAIKKIFTYSCEELEKMKLYQVPRWCETLLNV